jgi:hypothetical protein
MSDYQDIRGTRVKYLTSDPTLESSYEGQIWYNSTTGINKALVKIRAFSSGGTVPTRFYYPGAVGGTTDTLGIAGVGPSPQPAHNLCIEYSGFSWSAQPNLNTNRRAPYTFGTSTSCVASGGDYSPASPTLTQATEEWNGSSWTSVTNMPNNQGSFGAASGTLTAGLVYGGYGNPQSTSAKTVSYDGTNWTDLSSPGSDVVNGRNFTRGGGGTQTAAIFSGGNPTTGNTETFDGSSWSEQNNMSLARYGSGFIGTQTSGLYMGGRTPPRTGVTEDWDGSVWSTTASMATARNGTIHSKSGNASAAIVAAGYTGTAYPTTTEEYNANINAITKAAWSSGGALGTSRRYISGCGTKTAIVAFGGFKPGSANETELYNGSSWSEVNNLGTAGYGVGAAGTQTAALAFGGSNDVYESWDGSNWTSSSTLNTTRRMLGSCGTQTAALAFGGRPEPSTSAKTEEWNGSSWSNSNDLNTAVRNNMGSGIQTAALNSGGNRVSDDTLTGATEEYNGTSWTASPGSMNTARMASAPNTGGLQTAALVYGGLPPASAVTEQYDGTSWSATASMATARGQTGGGGTSTAGIVYGGSPPGSGGTDATEEFTGGTETVTASTLTTS